MIHVLILLKLYIKFLLKKFDHYFEIVENKFSFAEIQVIQEIDINVILNKTFSIILQFQFCCSNMYL